MRRDGIEEMIPLTIRRLIGKISQRRFPRSNSCGRCFCVWAIVKEHITTYDADGISGCFPLCESCWKSLSIQERMPYYDAMLKKSRSEQLLILYDYDFDWYEEKARAAVLAGR